MTSTQIAGPMWPSGEKRRCLFVLGLLVGRNRRLTKDFENLGETLAAFVTIFSIQLALRQLAEA